jgi:RND family efflux transporter MFP subunit
MLNILKKYRIYLIILLVLAAGFFGYRSLTKPTTYQTVKVQRQDLSETIELSGKIDADNRADLHFQTGGLITYLPFKENDKVLKNQTIAGLDQRQVQKDLTKYLNLYAIQRNSFENTKDDNQSQLSTDTSNQIKRILENNQYQLNNAVLDVEFKDLALQYSRLTAPFDGIITQMDIKSTGINVLPTDTFQIIDPNSLFFKANIDESDISKINEGQKTILTLDALPNEEFDSTVGTVAFASKETSTGTAYEAKFPLPSDLLSRLHLGFNGTAKVVLNEKIGVLSLPVDYVRAKGDQFFVTIKKDGQYVDQEVKTGIESDTYVEITDGLTEGETVYLAKTS